MSRIALVTGGTRGIGAEISRQLQAAGRIVVASYAGNDTAAEAFRAETGIAVKKFDAGSFAECEAAVAAIHAEFGKIEILVNNAGITRDSTLSRLTRDMWDAVIDTNLGSCFNLCKLTFDDMRAAKFGRVVNIGASTARPANMARSTTPPPNRASTASPKPWRRKVPASASP